MVKKRAEVGRLSDLESFRTPQLERESCSDMTLASTRSSDSEGRVDPRNLLNDLTGKKWIQETKSVWFQKGLGSGHPDTRIERKHPAPFSFQDIARLIAFFTKENGRVLDPFCGVASTLKACATMRRRGVGIELTKKWVDFGEERLNTEVEDRSEQRVIHGDCRDVLQSFGDEEFDFIVTSPPYWGILRKNNDHKSINERVKNGLDTHYGDDPDDLGNLPVYDDFRRELQSVFEQCHRVLKAKRYMCLVVSDFRHGSDFIPFHMDAVECMTNVGFRFEGITILVQNVKKLYPYGYPYAFVSNIHHQYILAFRRTGEMNGQSNEHNRVIPS